MTELEPEGRDDWLVHDLLQVDVVETDTALVLALHGELDANTAPQLRQQVASQQDSGRRLVIDTTGLQFCGSSGLAVFVEAHQHAAEHDAQLRVVVSAGSPLQRVLDAVGLAHILPIAPDLDTALR